MKELNIKLKSYNVETGLNLCSWLDIIKYPAGEFQVRIKPEYINEFETSDSIVIQQSIKSSDDILILALLVDAIRGVQIFAKISLFVPYLPYARADRRFTPGDCFGLKVFSQMIANMGFYRVLTLDAHSDVALDCGFVNLSPKEYIIQTINDVGTQYSWVNVLFPDAGAAKRYSINELDATSNVGGSNVKSLYCSKVRNVETGKFESFSVPANDEFVPNCPILIVDDLCDGGGTFIGIVEKLVQQKMKFNGLYLYVTHGIFSKGLNTLLYSGSGFFDRIYTTNSYYELPHGEIFNKTDYGVVHLASGLSVYTVI